MKSLKSSSGSRPLGIALVLALFLLVASIAGAVDKKPGKEPPQVSSAVGIRLGVWSDISNALPEVDPSFTTDLTKTGFATEIFFDIKIAPRIFCELSMAAVGRGDIVLRQGDSRLIGTVNLYPLLAQLKLSPLATPNHTVLPFILAGGGVAVGRQNTQFIIGTSQLYDPWAGDRTEAAFIAVLGGGCDIIVADQIGLNFVGKYIPMKFNTALAGLKDFSGMSFEVGISYFLHKK